MKWVTRNTVHLDRVASPWLIARFIDPEAEFVFIDASEPWPGGAVAFALPGALFSIHDEDGTTFEKILRAHHLDSPVLAEMAAIIGAAVRHVLQEDNSAVPPSVVNRGVALALISEGVMVQHHDDHAIIAASMGIYDALFAALWARLTDERTGVDTFWARMAELRMRWGAAPPLTTPADH
jgi:hypothetical protein